MVRLWLRFQPCRAATPPHPPRHGCGYDPCGNNCRSGLERIKQKSERWALNGH